jgi:prepilin-type N-terminal cleavage/methylation domain-containing protein
MKDTKGFTLVELLAVITILGLLGIIALEAIESVNKGNKEKAEELQRQNILTSAIAYVPTSDIYLPDTVPGMSGCSTYAYSATSKTTSGSHVCEVRIILNYLVKEGILEEQIENPLTGAYINMDSSYVRIYYVTSLSSISKERREKGQFDGNYFYELVY